MLKTFAEALMSADADAAGPTTASVPWRADHERAGGWSGDQSRRDGCDRRERRGLQRRGQRRHPRLITFPNDVWCQIWSNNPNDRLNREVRRRADMVGIFPHRESAIWPIGAVLAEQPDEWTEMRRNIGLDVPKRARLA